MTAKATSARLGAGACLAAVAVAGCGHTQGAPIPHSQAADIITRLKEADRRSAAMACHDLRTDTLPVLEQQASSLPQDVDSNVRATVTDGINHLRDLVNQQCSASSSSTTTPSSQTSTATTTTPPTTTTTVAPPPAPTTTQTTTPPTRTTTTGTGTAGGANGPPPGGGPKGTGPPGGGPNGTGPPGQTKKGK